MKSLARGLAAVIVVLGLVCGTIAQELQTFHGRVMWISGNTMAFAPDSGGSFKVDISQIDQSQYEFLKSGDAVTVVGVVAPDGNKVIAYSITPDR